MILHPWATDTHTDRITTTTVTTTTTGTARPPPLPAAFDTSVPDEALNPEQASRRALLRRTGLLGAGLAAGTVLSGSAATAAPTAPTAPAAGDRGTAGRGPAKGFLWLAGDRHVHTQYSSDGKYRVIDQVRQGARNGMDWLVITDHGSTTHARIGVEKVNPDIKQARAAHKDTLVFQGLEWNIPAAEHGTVFVHPGRNEVAVLKQFETDYDGSVKGAGNSTRPTRPSPWPVCGSSPSRSGAARSRTR
ncbi:hypothetical protein SALBM217S_08398 [Streptomyces griseoloalbus]